MSKTATIEIDGKTYLIEPLTFGPSLKLAATIQEALKGLSMDIAIKDEVEEKKKSDSSNKKDSDDQKISMDIGAIMVKFPDLIQRIVALGLNTTEDVVAGFKDSKAAMEAFDKIMEINDVTALIKKSMSLLKLINMS